MNNIPIVLLYLVVTFGLFVLVLLVDYMVSHLLKNVTFGVVVYAGFYVSVVVIVVGLMIVLKNRNYSFNNFLVYLNHSFGTNGTVLCGGLVPNNICIDVTLELVSQNIVISMMGIFLLDFSVLVVSKLFSVTNTFHTVLYNSYGIRLIVVGFSTYILTSHYNTDEMINLKTAVDQASLFVSVFVHRILRNFPLFLIFTKIEDLIEEIPKTSLILLVVICPTVAASCVYLMWCMIVNFSSISATVLSPLSAVRYTTSECSFNNAIVTTHFAGIGLVIVVGVLALLSNLRLYHFIHAQTPIVGEKIKYSIFAVVLYRYVGVVLIFLLTPTINLYIILSTYPKCNLLAQHYSFNSDWFQSLLPINYQQFYLLVTGADYGLSLVSQIFFIFWQLYDGKSVNRNHTNSNHLIWTHLSVLAIASSCLIPFSTCENDLVLLFNFSLCWHSRSNTTQYTNCLSYFDKYPLQTNHHSSACYFCNLNLFSLEYNVLLGVMSNVMLLMGYIYWIGYSRHLKLVRIISLNSSQNISPPLDNNPLD